MFMSVFFLLSKRDVKRHYGYLPKPFRGNELTAIHQINFG